MKGIRMILATLLSSSLVLATQGFLTVPASSRAQVWSKEVSTSPGHPHHLDALYSGISELNTVEPVLSKESTITPIKRIDEALRFNSSGALDILAEINSMRSNGGTEMQQLMNELVAAVDSPLPWWTKIRPLTKYSKRARRASLQRVLRLSTPTSEEKESIGDDLDASLRRKRQSLIVLLRALSGSGEDDDVDGTKRAPTILELEKAAKRKSRSTDIVTRLPPGLETPNYEVISQKSKSGFEIRLYQPFSVCSVSMTKRRPDEPSKTDAKISNPQLAGASAFGALAGYLFGKNDASTAMKMTTPVISTGDGDARQMAFVLPSDFWKIDGLQSAPKPLEGSGVSLLRDEGGYKAVIMFGGFAGKNDVESQTKLLLNELSREKEWSADPYSNVTLAQYNDPFTPPWKRRNEVGIKVLPRQ